MADPKKDAPPAPIKAPDDTDKDLKITGLSFASPVTLKKIGTCDAITTGKAKGGAKHVESIAKVTGGFNVTYFSRGVVNGVPRTDSVTTAVFRAFIPFGNVNLAHGE